MKNDQPFLTDVKKLRARARANIEDGAVTPAYQGEVKQTIDILQYTMNAIAATGISGESVKAASCGTPGKSRAI